MTRETLTERTYRCIGCRASVKVPSEEEGSTRCPSCGFEYCYGKNYLQYDFERLLFKQFRKKYLLYKVLANNASMAYQSIREGSLSCPERRDVFNFREYILSHVRKGRILDVGCGTLEVPGYLDFGRENTFELYGIDPIDDRAFRGMRVTGCAEFMPFQDQFFDALIFATSLDHVCSLEQTVREAGRVLSEDGRLILWMADPSIPWTGRIKDALLRSLQKLRKPVSPWEDVFALPPGESMRVRDFVIYPNLAVFQVPEGAVDPFHVSYETPRRITALMKEANLTPHDLQRHSKNEIFLCFKKGVRIRTQS
jgi:SAM-dependent methyltransferase